MNQLYTRQGFMQRFYSRPLREGAVPESCSPGMPKGQVRGSRSGFTHLRHAELVSASCRSNRGFTLIELLVVVLIIGILAAVAVPQYQKAVMKSRLASALTFVDAANKAMALYVLENGFPNAEFTAFTGEEKVDATLLDYPCTDMSPEGVGVCKPEGLPFYYHAGITQSYLEAYICFDTMCDGALRFRTDKSGNKTYACVQHGADEPDDTYCQLVQQLVPANWTFL